MTTTIETPLPIQHAWTPIATRCDYCDAPTTNTPDEAPYTACDTCIDGILWEQGHTPEECEAGPPHHPHIFHCQRDHKAETRYDHMETLWEQSRDHNGGHQ